MKIPSHLKKIISPQISKETKLTAAKGQISMEPLDLLVTFFLLAYDNDKEVASTARKSFAGMPTDTLLDILSGEVDPLILKTIAMVYKDNKEMLLKIALHENTDDETISMLASRGPEGIANAIAENKERLFSNPSLIDALKSNPLLSKSVVEKAGALIASVGREVNVEEDRGVIPATEEADEGFGPADHKLIVVNEDITEEKERSFYERVKDMNAGEKIKLAFLGNKEARRILIKDTNEMISTSVLRNPNITEEELINIVNSRDTPDRILRAIAREKKFLKNYLVKLGLITNPKTPLAFSLKFMRVIKEKDIKNLARSKNIPTVISTEAKRILERKSLDKL
jgi:hypothetical protein